MTLKNAEIDMTLNPDVIDVIHRRAAHPSVIPGKAQRFDQVDSYAHTCAQPQHSTNVLGNFGFKQGDAHGTLLAPMPAALQVLDRRYGGLPIAAKALLSAQRFVMNVGTFTASGM